MFFLKKTFFVFFISLSASAGQFGNSGDFIQSEFIDFGNEIVDFLNNNKIGYDIAVKYEINLLELERALEPYRIIPIDKKLVSKFLEGGVVAAKVESRLFCKDKKHKEHDYKPCSVIPLSRQIRAIEQNVILLNRRTWEKRFEHPNKSITYSLVFKELLRSAGMFQHSVESEREILIAASSIKPYFSGANKNGGTSKCISTDKDKIKCALGQLRMVHGERHYLEGGYILQFQNDGNLVLYDRAGNAPWSTGKQLRKGSNRCSQLNPCHAVFREDGNLVLSQVGKGMFWCSNTKGKGYKWLQFSNKPPYVQFLKSFYEKNDDLVSINWWRLSWGIYKKIGTSNSCK